MPAPQRIVLEKRRPLTRRAARSGTTPATSRPSVRTSANTNSRPPSSRTTSSETGIPWPRAKPSAAFVGAPSGPNAAAAAGPRTVRDVAGSSAGSPATLTANRRGATDTRTAAPFRPAASSAWRMSPGA